MRSYGVPFDFMHPLADVVEAVPIGDIVHDDDPMRPSVVRAGESSEALLAGGVPLEVRLVLPTICSLIT